LEEKNVGNKLKYDGDKLFMDLNLGTIRYYAPMNGVEEIYEAYRLEIHYPAEHYITIDNLTPRQDVEIQIYHKISKTNNPAITNSKMNVNRAILSMMFTIGEQNQGDLFFNNMGINRYNQDQNGQINFPEENKEVDNNLIIPGSYGKGFNYSALEGLINLINMDSEMFFYYGSETAPPCREDVFWMIFSKPRAIGSHQATFFNTLMTRHQKNKDEAGKLFGNNRRIRVIF
jgi:carbonic anhydrase